MDDISPKQQQLLERLLSGGWEWSIDGVSVANLQYGFIATKTGRETSFKVVGISSVDQRFSLLFEIAAQSNRRGVEARFQFGLDDCFPPVLTVQGEHALQALCRIVTDKDLLNTHQVFLEGAR